MNKEKTAQWGYYLSLGLYAFLGLGLEVILALLIEPLIFKGPINEYSTDQIIGHWIITIILWGIMALILIKISREKYGFNCWDYTDNMGKRDWIIALILILFSVVISSYLWKGLKLYKELYNLGLLKFIFQYIYYLMETVLVLLIIVFGQKAGELRFSKENFPWGGILLGLTWGLVHALTKGQLIIGLYGILSGILYGVIYLLTKKNVRIAYPLIACMFIL